MIEKEGNGAPYHILVTFPDTNERRTYECVDATTTLDDLTTIVLTHIKENIRGGTGVRMLFEVVAAPKKVEEENQEEKEEVEVKKPPKVKSAKVGDAPVPVIATVEEVTDASSDRADDTGE
jgi:hypothetical protein